MGSARRRVGWVGAALILLAGYAAVVPANAVRGDDGPSAASTVGDPTVGPLFRRGVSGQHSCTASVLDVPGDLLVTAAHCLTGTGVGIVFVPGYDGTAANSAPYGRWTVGRAWVSPSWVRAQDPQQDYAILQVADRVIDGVRVHLRSVTGGNRLGLAAASGTTVSIPAYPTGIGDAPLTCTTRTFDEHGFPGFRCGGYVGGTSGAPWLSATDRPGVRQVVGIIGGLHQGGCRADTSYSSRLDVAVIILMIRAVLDLPGDDVPARGTDGC